ncbi:hypothetical protein SLA2020_437370 [Shorea laevis]
MAFNEWKVIPHKQGSSKIARPRFDMGGKGSAYGGGSGGVKEKKDRDGEENNEERLVNRLDWKGEMGFLGLLLRAILGASEIGQ